MGDGLNKKTWDRIQKLRKKYNSTPNGWAVASLIGSEYASEASRTSPSKRKKNGKYSKKN
tara:strand:- start:5 stop:184 length:180 start_codon:yes stop_codon:yes gene_type:complete